MWFPAYAGSHGLIGVIPVKRLKYKDTKDAYLFLAPSLVIFITLVIFPILFSLVLSFTKWNFLSGFSGIQFVGLENFKRMTSDRYFKQAIINTFIYALTVVPLSILLALILAYVMNTAVFFKKTLRLCFFIPYISSTVALAAVFKYLFREINGPINLFLANVIRMQSLPQWFTDDRLNKIPIITLLIWTSIGYELIIYMASLSNISHSLYEAADIDGASGATKFLKITIPLISPTTFYLVIVRMIATFKLFTAVSIMTMGTSARANTTMVVRIYGDAFGAYKFGYASAEAWVLFVIILGITLIQFWGQRKWVHY
jgi:multiple sugar transport system permease protein